MKKLMEGIPSDEDIQQALLLRKQVAYHNHLYYTLDAPEITDSEYDVLFNKLRELEQKFPSLQTKDSPTQKVGGSRHSRFEEFVHRKQMYSLSNVFSKDDWEAFFKRVQENISEQVTFWCDPKMDGLALELVYENGCLTRALTRGDGISGEVVTKATRTVSNIPLVLANKTKYPEIFEVRGEIVIPIEGFNKLNLEQEQKGEKIFSNPRNAAAGSIRQLNPSVTASRPLKFLAYGVGAVEPEACIPSEYEQLMQQLKEYGFETPPLGKLCVTSKDVEAYYTELFSIRSSLEYEIDGVVIKVNQIGVHDTLGYTSRAPRFATAWKFPAEQAMTRLIDIQVQVGRTGVLTPVAYLEPVTVGGVCVSKATLHNEDEIKSKNLYINDIVIVQRAGDVIPEVIGSVLSKRNAESIPFVFPEQCPSCQTKVVQLRSEVAWRCVNMTCPARLRQSILYFASKAGLDIRGFGSRWIKVLCDSGRLKNPADFFTLTESDLLQYDRMGKTLATKMIHAIEEAKQAPLHRFICALGILHVGEQKAKILATAFKGLDALITASSEELIGLQDIGPEVANSIQEFFKNTNNIQMLQQFRDHGFWPQEYISSKVKQGKLVGKKVLFTGTLQMPRIEAQRLAEEAGAILVKAISSKIDYLIVGANPGSKFTKAQGLNIPIIDEEMFKEMLYASSVEVELNK